MKTLTDVEVDFAALLRMASPQRSRLERDLATCGIRLLTASDCGEARRVLESRPEVQVVVTDVTLTDGNWCDVVKGLVDGGKRAVLVCAKQHHERLYDEVVRRGAYYLLLEPYHRRAVELTMWAAAARHSVLSPT